MATRWGVAGCGKIANDFVFSWKGLPSENHVLVAAAARSLERAQQFANKFGGRKAYGSYMELAKDPEVEVVYVGTVNPSHLEVVTMMLEGGKHVLCEKPLGLNYEQTETMVKLARKKKLFLMEAIWSRCLPTYKELKKRLDRQELGDSEAVHATFGQNHRETVRVNKKSMGGGVVLDMGIYCIQFAQLVFRGEMPSNIFATGQLNEENVDRTVSIEMRYSSGKFANFFITSQGNLPCEAIIIGSNASVQLPMFWSSEQIKSEEIGNFEDLHPTIPEAEFNCINSSGLAYEAEEVRNCLLGGKLESDKISLDETLSIARIMQTIAKQLGSQY